MATIFFDLNGLPPSANKRLHHMARARSNKEWKDWATLAMRDAINRSNHRDLPWDRAHVHYIFHYPQVTHLDLDNLIGSMKPCLDATKGELLVDDSIQHVHRLSADYEVVKGQPAGVRIEVTRCECGDAQDSASS